MSAKLGNIFDRIISSMAYLAAALIIFAFLSVAAEVFARYVFNTSIFWVHEITEYIMAFFAIMAAAWVLKKGGHVSLDFVVNFLNPRKQAAVNAATSIIGAIITFVIAWYGASSVYDHFLRGTITITKYIVIPSWPLLTVVPIGFFMLSIQFLRRSYGYLRSWRKLPEEERSEDITTGMENV